MPKCKRCGGEITEDEALFNNGLCDYCHDEDYELEEGLLFLEELE